MAGINNVVMDRLKAVMLSDANVAMETLLKVLKSDLYCLFSEYIVIEEGTLKVEFKVENESNISINVSIRANKIIEIGHTIA